MEVLGTIILACLALFLVTQRWFWIWGLFLAGVASLFAMIASIVYFQILAALGLFILCGILFSLMSSVAEK